MLHLSTPACPASTFRGTSWPIRRKDSWCLAIPGFGIGEALVAALAVDPRASSHKNVKSAGLGHSSKKWPYASQVRAIARSRVIAGELHVRGAFLAALMLTGTIEAAEHAVSDAIAPSGCGLAADALLVATAKCAVQLRDEVLARGAGVPSGLPPELRRLFSLSSVESPMSRLANVDGTHPRNDLWNSKLAQG